MPKGIKGFQKGNKIGCCLKGRKRPDLSMAMLGNKHAPFKGGISQKYFHKKIKEYGLDLSKCSKCGFVTKEIKFPKKGENWILVHHIDGNRKNNSKSNYMVLCHKCHMSIHMTGNKPSKKTKLKISKTLKKYFKYK